MQNIRNKIKRAIKTQSCEIISNMHQSYFIRTFTVTKKFAFKLYN